MGIVSILAVWMLLGSGEGTDGLSETAAAGAFFGVIGLYAMNGFKILTGLIGICLASESVLPGKNLC